MELAMINDHEISLTSLSKILYLCL